MRRVGAVEPCSKLHQCLREEWSLQHTYRPESRRMARSDGGREGGRREREREREREKDGGVWEGGGESQREQRGGSEGWREREKEKYRKEK